MSVLRFHVRCGSTDLGDRVFIVGSTPELGGWRVGGGLACTTTEGTFPSWTSKDVIIEADKFDFKIVIVKAGGSEAKWEDGDNKKFIFDTTSARSSTVLSEYGMPGVTIAANAAANQEWERRAGFDLANCLLLAQMLGLQQTPRGDGAHHPVLGDLRGREGDPPPPAGQSASAGPRTRLVRPRQGKRGVSRSGGRSRCPPVRRPKQALPASAEAYSICSSGSEVAGEPLPTATELGLEAAASTFSPALARDSPERRAGSEGAGEVPPNAMPPTATEPGLEGAAGAAVDPAPARGCGHGCSPGRHAAAAPAVQQATAKVQQAATPCRRRAPAAIGCRTGGKSWSAREECHLPPSSTSWDWPLSRVEKKARVDMIDRSMLRANCRALAGKLRKSLGADCAAP